MASTEEKPISLNAFVKIKYAIYRTRIGKRIKNRYNPNCAKSNKTDMMKTLDMDTVYKPSPYFERRK